MSQAPNVSGFITTLVNKYPNEWRKAQQPHDDGAFCKAVAKELQVTYGKRWGLNAKRDSPGTSALSKDVVVYYLGPTDRHIEAYDFIIAHESSGAHIGWLDVTNYSTVGQPGTGRYVDPHTGQGYDGPPVEPTEPMMSLGQAAMELDLLFRNLPWNKEHRQWDDVEQNAIIAQATLRGYTGGDHIQVRIVNELKALISRYTGDIHNPLPVDEPIIDPNTALNLIQTHAQKVFTPSRSLTSQEIDDLVRELQALGLDLGKITQTILNAAYNIIDKWAVEQGS